MGATASVREPSTKVDTAELGQAIAIGGVVITRQRIVVVSGGEVIASFGAGTIASIAVVDGFSSKRPAREAVWGLGFIAVGVMRVVLSTRWWERAGFAAIALIGVAVSLNLLRRTTKVVLRHETGRAVTLLAGTRIPRAQVAKIADRLEKELDYRVER